MVLRHRRIIKISISLYPSIAKGRFLLVNGAHITNAGSVFVVVACGKLAANVSVVPPPLKFHLKLIKDYETSRIKIG